jgi:tripartite-type tricarboxylate transporter receptor subunit TctC
VHPSLPVKTTRELNDYARARPGQLKSPRVIIDKLNDEANRILRNPELREWLAAEGADFVGGTADAYGTFMRAESIKWAKVVTFARIKLD